MAWNCVNLQTTDFLKMCFIKVTSKRPLLFKTVLWLCNIEMEGVVVLNLIHYLGQE